MYQVLSWVSYRSLATVIGIDCSLIKMKFNSAREEWIYRGSPRLEPVYHFKVVLQRTNPTMCCLWSALWQDSVDEERGAWILRKGKDSAPTLKELLMAREFPCYMGDHMITCTAMSCEEPDDDITILCVKDGQGRLQSNGMRPQRQQEGSLVLCLLSVCSLSVVCLFSVCCLSVSVVCLCLLSVCVCCLSVSVVCLSVCLSVY